jgi:hypothetical protein
MNYLIYTKTRQTMRHQSLKRKLGSILYLLSNLSNHLSSTLVGTTSMSPCAPPWENEPMNLHRTNSHTGAAHEPDARAGIGSSGHTDVSACGSKQVDNVRSMTHWNRSLATLCAKALLSSTPDDCKLRFATTSNLQWCGNYEYEACRP